MAKVLLKNIGISYGITVLQITVRRDDRPHDVKTFNVKDSLLVELNNYDLSAIENVQKFNSHLFAYEVLDEIKKPKVIPEHNDYCKKCGAPALLLFNSLECSKGCQ